MYKFKPMYKNEYNNIIEELEDDKSMEKSSFLAFANNNNKQNIVLPKSYSNRNPRNRIKSIYIDLDTED